MHWILRVIKIPILTKITTDTTIAVIFVSLQSLNLSLFALKIIAVIMVTIEKTWKEIKFLSKDKTLLRMKISTNDRLSKTELTMSYLKALKTKKKYCIINISLIILLTRLGNLIKN